MKITDILTASKDISHEYCCTIIQVGEITPIEGSDFLATTMVNGMPVVIRKDEVKTGDVLFYAANETQLNKKFLSVNNQFEISEYAMNANAETVKAILADADNEQDPVKKDEIRAEAKKHVGFFNKTGRVKMIRLRKQPSMGYLFNKQSMAKFCPEIESINITEHIGMDFDTVKDELFVKVYVPYVKENTHHTGTGKRLDPSRKFDRMIPGEFILHYDTDQLNRNMHRITPNSQLTISLKLHGTSCIFGRVKTKAPMWGGIYAKIFNYLPKFLKFTTVKYDNIYSSRKVIKNQYINKDVGVGYYKTTDPWTYYFNLIKDYIADGMTVYGEICGYGPNSDTMIQQGYDYGCKTGENFLMIYRITTDTDGTKKEWEVTDVYDWVVQLKKRIAGTELADRLHPIDILYHGSLANLYPEVAAAGNNPDDYLAAMRADKEHFGMEDYEPMCKNKVYREGLVVRIDNDPIKEAFKLKCLNFLGWESKNLENLVDPEMQEKYE